MPSEEMLRLYLADNKAKCFFQDHEILFLLSETESIEAAAALGWLLKAAGTSTEVSTLTIGQVSQTRGQLTESFKVAMAMHAYWSRQAELASGSAFTSGRWMELLPDGPGIIPYLSNQAIAIYESDDFSRLL